MKKSLLAAGALAALGGLGFAGSAQAIWAVQPVGEVDATELSATSNTGVGHILLTPYYSTVGQNATLLTIVNTDTENGKAVKVRFRGAANSDDVLDFTVLLSAGDVWSAAVSQDANGFSRLVTPDNSCVLPEIPTVASGGVSFASARLDRSLSVEAQGAHTQEGYVEWLNMADIPENDSKLSKAITHKDNKAPCDAAVMEFLMNPKTVWNEEDHGADYPFEAPTGGLMGNWSIFNTANVTSYGGPNAAIVALGENSHPAAGRLFFSPQVGPSDATFPATVAWVDGRQTSETADPLLANAGAGGSTPPLLEMLPFDLPDLSTPYTNGSTAPEQSLALSAALAATKVMNEWTAGTDNGTDFSTDWVFSQPTRRYHAAVNYTNKDGSGNVKPVPVYNTLTAEFFYPGDTMVPKVLGPNGMYGTVLCLGDNQVGYKVFNREEGLVIPRFSGEWSPSTPADAAPGFCGEVATLTFGGAESKSLNAQLTTYQVQNLPAGGAGWMSVTTRSELGLPVIGYAANTFSGANGSNVGNYGDAITHRYERSLAEPPQVELPMKVPAATPAPTTLKTSQYNGSAFR